MCSFKGWLDSLWTLGGSTALMNRSNISRYSLLLLYKFYVSVWFIQFKVFPLSSGLNMSSISSSELQWIPLFVQNSPVTLLPNWFWNSKEESPVVEIYWNSKKFSEQKARVRVMTWVLKVSPWSTTRPVHNPSSIQLSRPDTWWDHPSKRSPARDTDTTSCHSLNNVTFFCVVNHKLKSGLNTKQTLEL